MSERNLAAPNGTAQDNAPIAPVPAHRYHIHQGRKEALQEKPDPRPKWTRAGSTLGGIALVFAALCLGIVALVATLSTVWLMTGAKDGNLTQSMSIYTILAPSYWPVLGAGFIGVLVILLLCILAWRAAAFLDGKRGLTILLDATFVFQLLIILLMQTRDTYWGDSWMIRDFVNAALEKGSIESIFTGAYNTLFYDARLYFSCYPFQASFFWVLYALRLVFGDFAYMAFQILNALVTELGVFSLVVLGEQLGLNEASETGVRGRRVFMLLIALCLPMYWLSTFIYGNAMGCGFALAFLALQAKAMQQEGRTRMFAFGALSLVPLVLALCIKKTFVLFAIAAVLAWIILAIQRRSGWGLALCIAVVFAANGIAGLPFEALRAASGGYEFSGSLTTLNHLELGLRMGNGEFYVSENGGDVSYAPGGWSNYANGIWAWSNGNADLQNQSAMASLGEDLTEFLLNPAYAWWFFTTKLAGEWADPTYQSLYYLSMAGTIYDGRINPADTSTPLGIICTVLTFLLDGYQTVAFIAALTFVVCGICKLHRTKKTAKAAQLGEAQGEPARGGVPNETEATLAALTNALNPTTLLLGLTFFTGFGCYLLWEAKSVYVLPFAIVVIPLAAAGLTSLFARKN